MPRAHIKDEKTYQDLRRRGESKEKSARIANAAAARSPATSSSWSTRFPVPQLAIGLRWRGLFPA